MCQRWSTGLVDHCKRFSTIFGGCMLFVVSKFAPVLATLVIGVTTSPRPLAESAKSPPPPALCVEAREWVAANPAIRPKDLATLAALPAHYQRALFNEYSDAERASLWRQHFARYTSSASRFTPAQKAFIHSVGRSVESFIRSKPSERDIERFALNATLVLGRQEAKLVFGRLGVLDPTVLDLALLDQSMTAPRGHSPLARASTSRGSGSFRLARYTFAASIPAISVGSGERQGCGCHTGSIGDFCDTGTGPQESCKAVSGCSGIGCGWLFLQECNGNCQLASL